MCLMRDGGKVLRRSTSLDALPQYISISAQRTGSFDHLFVSCTRRPLNSNMIKDVWATNLEVEMRQIRNYVDRYPYVAMVSKPTLELTYTGFIHVRIRSFLG